MTLSHTTKGGVIMAPTELPVLNQPAATDRSLGGNHIVEVLTAAGMAAASATPSMPRNSAMPCQLPAKACRTQAVPHSRAKMK